MLSPFVVNAQPQAPPPPTYTPPPGIGAPAGRMGGGTRKLEYLPPRVGAPIGRVGGGMRRPEDALPVVLALAPDHTCLTTHEQPTLYWYISTPTSYPIELTVIEEQATRPLVETRLPSPAQAGVQRVRLAEYGIRLAPGVQYRWFVALVPDTEHRAQDVIMGGIVQRIEPPAAVRAELRRQVRQRLPLYMPRLGYGMTPSQRY